MTERMHTTMGTHPDVLQIRERFVLAERAARTQRGQAVEAMALIAGLYMAASPRIAGMMRWEPQLTSRTAPPGRWSVRLVSEATSPTGDDAYAIPDCTEEQEMMCLVSQSPMQA